MDPAFNQETRLYLNILEEFPALIWRSNTDGLCDYFNQTWLGFTGRTAAQEAGNGWAEGVHPDDLQRCVDYYFEHFHRREAFRMEYRLRHHSGDWRWILDIGRPFYGLQGEFLGYIGSCYDITEQRQLMDDLKAAGELRDQLFSILGHDLRNLIGTMDGLADTLMDRFKAGFDAEEQQLNAALHSSGQEALQLLQNLTLWGASKARKISLVPEPVDLAALAASQIQLQAHAAGQKSLALHYSLPAGTTVLADRELLAACLRNLLGNAVKFSHPGGGITISLSDCGPGRLGLTVRDSGIGMSADIRNQILAGQAVRSRRGTRQEGGSGLGLVLVGELLSHFGGRLLIDSQPDQGTAITLDLPRPPVA